MKTRPAWLNPQETTITATRPSISHQHPEVLGWAAVDPSGGQQPCQPSNLDRQGLTLKHWPHPNLAMTHTPPPSIETISQPSTTNADSCPDTEYLAKKHIAVKDTRLTPVLEKTGDHKLITFVEDSQ